MAGGTAAPLPLYYIATEDLYITGPGGPVRAFAPGDHVPPGHVARFGWQDGVEVPGDDEPGPPPAGPAAADSTVSEHGPELAALDGTETVLPAAAAPAAAPPPAGTPAPGKTSTTSDGGQPAERTTTP